MAGRQTLHVPSSRFATQMRRGVETLNGVDGRSLAARRYREVAAAMAADLTSDPDTLTEAMRQVIRTAAGLVVLREQLDVRAVNGDKIDSVEYARIANSLRRVLTSIGLGRRAMKDVTADALDYARRYARDDDDEREVAE